MELKRFCAWARIAVFGVLLGAFLAAPVGAGVMTPPYNQNAHIPRIRIASNFGGWHVETTTLSNGTTQTSGTERFRVPMFTDTASLQLIYVNGYADSTGIINPPGNSITLHAPFEVGGLQLARVSVGSSTGTPISTGGRTGNVIGDGEMVISQPITDSVYTTAANVLLRQYKVVASGNKWPMTYDSTVAYATTTETTDVVYGTTVTDQSDQTAAIGNQAWGSKGANAFFFAPIAIVGEQKAIKPVHEITGDSISAGFSGSWGEGYIAVGLIAGSVNAWHNDGISGITCVNLANFGQVPQYIARYADYVHVHCGTNDTWNAAVTSLASFQTRMFNIVRAFGSAQSRVVLYTIFPRTGSSNGWIDQTHQTQDSGCGQAGGTGCETLRVQENNWLRDPRATGAGCVGGGAVSMLNCQLAAAGNPARVAMVIDATPGIERNSDGSAVVLDGNLQQTPGTGGYWISNASANFYTGDGIHCKTTCEALVAPYVTAKVSLFKLF